MEYTGDMDALFTPKSKEETSANTLVEPPVAPSKENKTKLYRPLPSNSFDKMFSPETSVTDWKHSAETMGAHSRVLEYVESNKYKRTGLEKVLSFFGELNDSDPAEFVRDQKGRIFKTFADAGMFDDAPEEIKKDVSTLIKTFDESNLTGAGEWGKAFLDYGVDVLPELAATGLAATKLKKFSDGKKMLAAWTSPKGIGVDSGIMTGIADSSYQNLKISADMQEEYNYVQTLGFTTLGGIAGYGFARVLSKGDADRIIPPDRGRAAQNATRELNTSPRNLDRQAVTLEETKNLRQLELFLKSEADYLNIPVREGYVAPEIIIGPTGKYRKNGSYVAAKYNGEENKIYLDPEYIRTTMWEEKAWTKPKVEGVKPIPEGYIRSPDDLVTFIRLHEVFHSKYRAGDLNIDKATKAGKAEYENVINDFAIRELRNMKGGFRSGLIDDISLGVRDTQEKMDEINEQLVLAIHELAEKGGKLSSRDLTQLQILRALVRKNDGGEDMLAEIADEIALAAKNSGIIGKSGASTIMEAVAKNPQPDDYSELSKFILGNKFSRGVAKITSRLFGGKASGGMTPYVAYSPIARETQIGFSYEFGKKWWGKQQRIQPDLSETYSVYHGGWMDDYTNVMFPLAQGLTGVKKLRGKVIPILSKDADGKISILNSETNDLINLALRGQPTADPIANQVGQNLRAFYSDMGDVLLGYSVIERKVKGYMAPRLWYRDKIEADPVRFKQLLVEEGVATTKTVDALYDNFLDKAYHLDDGIGVNGKGGGAFFTKNRTLDIKNDAKFVDFMEQDVRQTALEYMHQAAKAVAKKERFGASNLTEFNKRIVEPMIREIKANKPNFSDKESGALKDYMHKLYQSATSEGLDRFGPTLQGTLDTYALLTRLSLLPAATVTSLSEIFISIQKAGIFNSVKGFAGATRKGRKLLVNDFEAKLKANFGKTARETQSEMTQNGIALEHGMNSLSNRLVGENLSNETMQHASDIFFKTILLSQWTQFVQATAFISGKQLIHGNLKALTAHGNAPLTRRIKRMQNELADLNIDVEEGIRWFSAGSRTEDDFYKTSVNRGAARFANEVILQPTNMAATKPLWIGNPKAAFMYQLLTYPTVFSNTIIKGAVKKLTRDADGKTVANMAVAAVLMTEMQRVLNDIRSDGKSEEEGWAHSTKLAVERWGGLGIFGDQANRSARAAVWMGNSAPFIAMPLGVFGSDMMALPGQGFMGVFGPRLIPGYALPVAKEFKKEKVKQAKGLEREVIEALLGEPKRKESKFPR